MDDTVDFDIFPGAICNTILTILEGYVSPETNQPVILVVLTNGAVLEVAVNATNLAAVAAWRKWKRAYGYSG